MLRMRHGILASLALAAAAGCAKDEFAAGPAAPAPGAPPAAAQQPQPSLAGPPQFAADERSTIRALPGAKPDSTPLLEVRAWTRDGRAVPDLEYDVYWQTDEGPSLTAGKTGPEGWGQNPFPSGALIHRVFVRPTGYTASLLVQVAQYAQPGRIVRVDGLILPAAVVSGVVVDETGAPLPGATLAGFQQPILQVDESERPVADNAGIADENGMFRLGGFGPGPFVLEAGAEGRVNVWRLAGVLEEGQEIGGVELQMEPAHVVHGQVLSEDGEPVRGARVVAGKPGRRQLTRPGPTAEAVYVPARQGVARSDEQGVFQLPVVPDSQEWNLNVDHPRFRKFLGRIEAGQVDVVVKLVKGLEARGIVFGADGQRLAGAAVVLLGGDQPAADVTNRQGVFAIGGLEAASGTFLCVTHAEHAPLLLGPVDLASGQELQVRLGASVRLGGVLRDAGGQPLAGARVTLHFEDLPEGFPAEHYPADLASRQSGLSSASGAFLFDAIPAGKYRVEVTAADGRHQEFPGVGTGAEDVELVITVAR